MSKEKGNKDKVSKAPNNDVRKHFNFRSAETGQMLSIKDTRILPTSVAKEIVDSRNSTKTSLTGKQVVERDPLIEVFEQAAREAQANGLTEEMAEKIIQELDEEYRKDTSPLFSSELEEALKKEGFTKNNLKRIREEARTRVAKREQKS